MNTKTLVKSLKGSQAQVLWAFFFSWKALDLKEVIEWTALKRETCYQALNALEGDWLGTQTLAHGRKVWLLKSEMLPILRDLALRAGTLQVIDGNGSEPESIQESEKRTSGDVVVVNAESKLISPTIATITTTTIGQESEKRTPAEWSALAAALDKYAIIGKKRRELIECEWMTAEYVHANVKYATDERTWDQPVGMAITRMLEHWLLPDAAQEPAGPKAGDMIRTSGRGKRQETLIIPAEIVKEVAGFTGHREECPCMDCTIGRLQGVSSLCPECKHYQCECEESEDE